MFGEMLKHGAHTPSCRESRQGFPTKREMCSTLRTRSLSPADMSMMRCLPHMRPLHPVQCHCRPLSLVRSFARGGYLRCGISHYSRFASPCRRACSQSGKSDGGANDRACRAALPDRFGHGAEPRPGAIDVAKRRADARSSGRRQRRGNLESRRASRRLRLCRRCRASTQRQWCRTRSLGSCAPSSISS
jgi:hypothetical protein